jgi:hypothetical protein
MESEGRGWALANQQASGGTTAPSQEIIPLRPGTQRDDDELEADRRQLAPGPTFTELAIR